MNLRAESRPAFRLENPPALSALPQEEATLWELTVALYSVTIPAANSARRAAATASSVLGVQLRGW